MAIRSTLPLRAPEEDLSSSRQQFIQTLENKKVFEQECAVIIPELDRLWKEKVLTPFNLVAQEGTVVSFKHYLCNYRPQTLSRAISRLASRLKGEVQDGKVSLVNNRGPVNNIAAYYKSLVQDIRKQEVRRLAEAEKQFRQMTGQQDSSVKDPRDLDEAIVTGRSSTIPGLDKPECQQCFDEEGSLACIRPAHKFEIIRAQYIATKTDLCPNCGLPPANDPMLPTGVHICRNSAPRRTQQ